MSIPTDPAPELECEGQVGSINQPTVPPGTATEPFMPPTTSCTGTWDISAPQLDQCAQNEVGLQQAYAAETISISGAPINFYKLLGIHQQGGSVKSYGSVIASYSAPGYPATGINGATPWRSSEVGANVVTYGAYVGYEFGRKVGYEPSKANWTNVGALTITQSNLPGYYASQVKVEIADGRVTFNANGDYMNTGDGTISNIELDQALGEATIVIQATSPTTFSVGAITRTVNIPISIGTATVGVPFYSEPFSDEQSQIGFTINNGAIDFIVGDFFTIDISYVWLRQGIYNLAQSPDPQRLNFKSQVRAKAVRVVPTLFSQTGSWEVSALDVFEFPFPAVDVIQDLFLNENRDRDYQKTPVPLKVQYDAADNATDLSRFGISILDQYSFKVAWSEMISQLGRPIVVGDIFELIPELQWDHNMKPIKKFLEVSETGWSSAGFTPHNVPTVFRFNAQQALPSQETRDIFGTVDTQKYLVADSVLADPNVGEQLSTVPLAGTEEIAKAALDAVPELGTDDRQSIQAVRYAQALPPVNAKGQPTAVSNPTPSQGTSAYLDDGLPPNGEAYTEGYALPTFVAASSEEIAAANTYFRLNYPPNLNLPSRLYRYSLDKHMWVYQSTDRRYEGSSIKPSVRAILNSANSQSITKKI